MTALATRDGSLRRLSRLLRRALDAQAESFGDPHGYDWYGRLARPAQRPPEVPWRTWVVLAGRGFGKTRTGAEWVRHLVETGQARRVALVAPTAADARDVMVEGESGILAICPPWDRPRYEPSKRRLTWPNGAIATTYSADEPERLRGPQHDSAWLDEVCAWRYPNAYDMLMFGLRLGRDPRCCVTTTPRPTPLLKELIARETTVRTGGSTYENRANLAPAFFDQICAVYEGTRLGQQEIHAELLEVAEGAWFPNFDRARHVTAAAEYVPGLPVHLAIDCGTSRYTGAVFFQVREVGAAIQVNVFADYLAVDLYSEANAEAIRDLAAARCGGRLDRVRLDPASGQRTGVGPVVANEYRRVFGERIVSPWPLRPVVDGLELIELFLGGPGKLPALTIHPRCEATVAAFLNYARAQRAGEWLDMPKDSDHPHEDLMDALRGGLVDRFPEGRRPARAFRTVSTRDLF